MSRQVVMSRRAFTLVELLVVMGVVCLLVGLLMPALETARESSRQTWCASNLRTLATGLLCYAQDNHGSLPGIATMPQQPSDWIYWNALDGPPYNDPGQGTLAHYVGRDPSVYRCPSDDWADRQYSSGLTDVITSPYRFSYQMNPFAQIARYQCCIAGQQCKLTAVRDVSEKILLIEANELKMVDGCWVPPPSPGSFLDDTTGRHDSPGAPILQVRSNVAFADTHVEFVTRQFIHDPKHYLP